MCEPGAKKGDIPSSQNFRCHYSVRGWRENVALIHLLSIGGGEDERLGSMRGDVKKKHFPDSHGRGTLRVTMDP
jgi:hypothetical protein